LNKKDHRLAKSYHQGFHLPNDVSPLERYSLDTAGGTRFGPVSNVSGFDSVGLQLSGFHLKTTNH